MTDKQEQFLRALIECPGPSSREEEVQRIWRDEVASFSDDVEIDIHGNNIATIKKSESLSILIVGHADEVALAIRHINDQGFLYVSRIGGVDPGMLPSHRVRILSSRTNGIVPGVVGRTSEHLLSKEEKGKVKFSDVWIDIGAASKEEAEKLVAVGDTIIYGEGYQRLHGTRATARCFDNRIGLYIVAETMRELHKRQDALSATVYGVSSIQEETGLWAAGHAAYPRNPTLAIALDVMPCTDSPGISREMYGDTRVSGGVVIQRGIRCNRKISERLIALATEKGIPYQIDIEVGYTHTDADPISSIKSGIPIGVLSAPTRYLHSACEVLDLVDLDHTVNLLTEFILSLKEGIDLRPGV